MSCRRQPIASQRNNTVQGNCHMKTHDAPKSGRRGCVVYYMRGNKQCRRRYFIPKDRRTPAQLRVRAAFGAASKAWSHSERLTGEQRDAWYAAGEKIQSRLRLGQSGPLTGQQHFVGRNCSSARVGQDMLWEPPARAGEEETRSKKEERRRQKAEAASQAAQNQRFARSTSGTRRGCPIVTPAQGRNGMGRARKAGTRMAVSQVQHSQGLARSTSDRYRSASVVLPWWCRRGTGGKCGMRGTECGWRNGRKTGLQGNVHRRELWRGG